MNYLQHSTGVILKLSIAPEKWLVDFPRMGEFVHPWKNQLECFLVGLEVSLRSICIVFWNYWWINSFSKRFSLFIYFSWMFVTVFGNFQQVYLHIYIYISMFGTVHFVWELVPTMGWRLGWGPKPTTPKRKVFALIPNTPGAHSICVHCAAKDPTRGFGSGVCFVCFVVFLGWFGEGGWVVVSWNICSKK